MRNLYRILWVLGIGAALTGMLVTYTQVGDLVYVAFGPGLPAIGRDYYFYGAGALIFMNNILWFMLSRLMPAMPPRALPIPAKDYWLSNKYRYNKAREILTNWMLTFGTVTNYWIMVFLFGLGKPNSLDPDLQFLPGYYAGIGWVFTILLITPFMRLYVRKLSIMFQVEDED